MKIVFFGIMFCDDAYASAGKREKAKMSIATDIFQRSLIGGFNENEGVSVTVINRAPSGSFPINSERVIMPEYRWGKDSVQVGYLNLPFVKYPVMRRKMLAEFDRVMANVEDGENVKVIFYGCGDNFLKIAAKVRQKYPEVELCEIQTDTIPGIDGDEACQAPRYLRKAERTVRGLKVMDKFVLLTHRLAELVDAGDRPYTVAECICSPDVKPAKKAEDGRKCFLYSGALYKEYGVSTLAEAFRALPEAELWVCGNGEETARMQELSEEIENVRYFGFVDRDELSKLRDKCSFLINPRRPTGTYTKYSFPSKTAEYLVSGKPTVMYKLEGIPDEYDEYLNYLSAADADGIAAELRALLGEDYEALCKRGEAGRAFMLENKNAKAQAAKIISLLEKGK